MLHPVLRIWVNPSIEGLRELYETHIEQHNKHVLEVPHPNSGFDLFIPQNENFSHFCDKNFSMEQKEKNKARLVNHQIKAAMYNFSQQPSSSTYMIPTAYYLYPRSSIYKTPLMLANSAGIIDSGYRGWICSAVRFLPREEDMSKYENTYRYTIEKSTKLTQICHPTLAPFLVELVEDEEILEWTSRGEGGFGSTGK